MCTDAIGVGDLPAALAYADLAGNHPYLAMTTLIPALALKGKLAEATNAAARMWAAWQRAGHPSAGPISPALAAASAVECAIVCAHICRFGWPCRRASQAGGFGTGESAGGGPHARHFPAPADLSLTNAGAPNPAVSGQPLTYTLQAANTGGQDATAVTVNDPLPASAVFKSMSATQGSCTRTVSDPNKNKDGTVNCTLGILPGGGTATVTITVTPTKPGTLTAQAATVTAGNISPAGGDDSATATVTVQGI